VFSDFAGHRQKKNAHGCRSVSDKLGVTFDIGIAFVVVIAATAGLVFAGRRNRQSGWRRQPSNAVLDLLIAWAHINAEVRREARTPPQQAAGESSLASQLSALHVAVGQNAGMSPQLQPTPVTKRDIMPISAERD
jgi:hypothetical protein